MFDENQALVVCNEQFASMYGLPPALTRAGTELTDILNYRFEHGTTYGDRDEFIRTESTAIGSGENCHKVHNLADGRIIAVQFRCMAGGGWVATHEDITERKNAEAQISYLAHNDVLTGLPNRAQFRIQLEKQFARVSRGDRTAVLCLDLDHFKAVNDTLGHPVGDTWNSTSAGRCRRTSSRSTTSRS
jgi:predicted signal transduction protein with EAL and GGDEF domain